MGVAAPQVPAGARSLQALQKSCHGPLFIGQLLSRNQVLHNKSG